MEENKANLFFARALAVNPDERRPIGKVSISTLRALT